MRTSLYLTAVALALAATGNSAAQSPEPMPTISVTGTAEVLVQPDKAVLQAAVRTRAAELAEATRENDAKIDQVVQFLKQSGVDEKSVRTTAIQIEPIFAEPSPKAYAQQRDPFGDGGRSGEFDLKPKGYSVYRGLEITVTDLERFEAIYRGLIERGINDVSGIEFQTSELRKHKDEARLSAVRAAREKATALAGELGATLAAVQSINEQGDAFRYSNTMQVSNAFGDPFGGAPSEETVAAGQISINASVGVVFRLGDVEMDDD